MATVEPFGEKLRHLRRALGLTQLELALVAGVSERTVRNAERGRPIKRDYLDYLAGALGIDIRELAREPAAVASLLLWRRNVAAVNEMVRRMIFESDGRDLLDMIHSQAVLRMHYNPQECNMAGMSQDFRGDFVGLSGTQRWVERIQEFNTRLLNRELSIQTPVGDGNFVFMRGTETSTYLNGDQDRGWWLHAFEFDDQRLLRCDEYFGLLPKTIADASTPT